MVKPNKKNKKALKKGKAQESDTPTPQPEVPEHASSEADEQQLAAATPLPETEEASDLPSTPAPDELQSAPVSTSLEEGSDLPLTPMPGSPKVTQEAAPLPAAESAPESVPVLESPSQELPQPEQQEHPEQAQTSFDSGDSPQPFVEDDGFTQISKPSTPSNQPSTAIDAETRDVQEPSHEELGAWEQLETPELKNDNDDTRTQESNLGGTSEQTVFTAPQSPTLTSAPQTAVETSGSWPSWEENDFAKAPSTQEETAPKKDQSSTDSSAEFAPTEPAPAPGLEPGEDQELSQGAEASAKNDTEAPQESTNPFVDPASTQSPSVPEQKPVTIEQPQASEEPEQTQEAASANDNTEASHTLSNPFTESASIDPASTPTKEAVENPEPDQAPEVATELERPQPALPEKEPVTSLEQATEAAREVTPPVSKPQSPAPTTAPPSYKSASPTQRAMSPAATSVVDTVDGQHMYQPIPPTAPTPPVASPKTHHAPPAKDAAFPAPRAAPPTPPSASPQSQHRYPMDQAFSPRQKSASSSYKHPSPVRKPSSPLPKVSSPLAHNFASPVMSPRTASIPPMPPSFPPSASHSYSGAYQSPPMSSTGFYPPQYGYYPPTSHPHAIPRGPMPSSGGGSFPGMPDLSFVNGHDRFGRRPVIPTDQEDPRELLDRIQEAIPDINRLLGSFKHTKTQLQSREVEFKQMESQHKQALMHKDFFIEALQNQLRKAANESAEEATRLRNMINELRMELGNMDEKRRDLDERLGDSESSVGKLKEEKADLEEQVKKRNEQIEEERKAHSQELANQRAENEAEKEEALTIQKQELTELFEEIRTEDEKTAAEALAARETELLEQQESMKAEHEEQKQQMQESYNTLQAEFDSKLTELATTKDDLEQKHKELEDTRQAHAEQVESLEISHRDNVTEKERVWNEEKTGFETQLSDKAEELANSSQENKRLEESVLYKEKQLDHSVDSMRVTINNLDGDCDRLKKTLHSLGEATDLKNTKGDTFL